MALVFALTGQSMAQVRGANEAAEQVVLCIGADAVRVYVDDTGAPTQAPHFCPDCTLTLLTAILPGGASLPEHFVAPDVFSMPWRGAIPADAGMVYLSRAPPVLI